MKTLGKLVMAIVIFVAIKACFSLPSHMAMDSTLNSGHDTAGATEAASKRQVQPYSSPGEQTSAQGAGASPSNAKGAHERSQPTRHELLRAFVDEFVVNNKNSRYPIKINEETYLTGRSIRDESDRMFVVEDYRIITPVAVTLGDSHGSRAN